MKGWITKRFGSYVLKIRSDDIEKLRGLACQIRERYDVDFRDLVK